MIEERTLVPRTWAGTVAGLFLGYSGIRFGLAAAVLIGLCGAIGYAIAAVLSGEIDLLDGLTRMQQRRRIS